MCMCVRERQRGQGEGEREKERKMRPPKTRAWRERKYQELETISHSLLHGLYFMRFVILFKFRNSYKFI